MPILDQYGRPFSAPNQDSAVARRISHNGSVYDPPDNFALPHVWTFSSVLGSAYKTYWHDRFDEAMKHSREDAVLMRNDCHLMRLMQERKLASASMNWHLEIPDEKDAFQVLVRDDLTTRLKATRGLKRIFMSLLEAIWYGRYGIQMKWFWDGLRSDKQRKSLGLRKWLPVNGDKIGHLYDGTPYILIYSPAAQGMKNAELTMTTRGWGLVLRGDWRERFCLHASELDDADFFDAEQAEAVHGVGVRSRLFWIDWIKREWLANVATFMQRVGLGVTCWYYEAGNPASEAQATQAAKEQSGRVNILWPRSNNGKGTGAGVERMEVPTGGAAFLLEAQKWMGELEELYVIGQTLSSKSEGGGLGGSGVADLHSDTKQKIAAFDAANLADSLTGDEENPGIVYTMKKWTWPEADFPVWFKFDIEKTESKEKLEAASKAWEMGADVKEADVLSAAGLSKPTDGDKILSRQQQEQQFQQMQGQQQAASKQQELQAQQQGQEADRAHQLQVEQLRQQAAAAQQPPTPVKVYVRGGPKARYVVPGRQGLPYGRHGHSLRYAKGDDQGRWITIGGSKGEGGKKHGGSPVFIKNGVIEKGAPGLTGKKISALKDEAVDSTHRKDAAKGRDYDKAVWGKKARKAGIDPEHLHQLAKEIQAHDKAHVEDRKALLRDARATLTKKGYDARALTTNLRSGRVENDIPGLDELVDEMSKRYPEQFAGHDDTEARLLDLLAEGNPEAIDAYSAYQHAFDQIEAQGGSGDDSEPEPWDEPESIYYMFDPNEPRNEDGEWKKAGGSKSRARGKNMKTEERRNRELGERLAKSLRDAGIEVTTPDGWGDSIYATVNLDDWDGKLRISDHDAPEGGGYSEAKGERHGDADINVRIDTGSGAGLQWGANDSIVKVPLARVSFAEDVPENVKTVIEPLIAQYAEELAKRKEASAKSVKKRTENKTAKTHEKLVNWHRLVLEELGEIPNVRIKKLADAHPDDPGCPEPFVEKGTPNGKALYEAASKAIEAAYKRAFARQGK